MSNITQEDIDKSIKECRWLSDNADFSMPHGVCIGECGLCVRVIDSGHCPTLRQLFGTDKNPFSGLVK